MQNSSIQDLHKREEDYIYNRTIIGGIDESHFNFGLSIRKKIYLAKPSKGSWIVLILLAIFSIGGTFFYRWYLNRNIQNAVVVTNTVENNFEFIKSKLLEVKFPPSVDDDPFVKLIDTNSSTSNTQSVKLILDPKNIDEIGKEVDALHKLATENIEE